MTTRPFIACMACSRRHKGSSMPDTCDAFPGGVPDEIITGAHLHTTPVDGDNGLLFKLMDSDVAKAYYTRLITMVQAGH